MKTMKLSNVLETMLPSLPWKFGPADENNYCAIYSESDPGGIAVWGNEEDDYEQHEIAKMRYITHAANMLPGIVEAMKEARVMADNLRRATGDALPGTICWTLSRALEKAETVHLETDASSLNPDKV
jgi:hypothetical protein